MNEELDEESKLALIEQEHAARLATSEDWKWAKDKLTLLIEAVMSIETLKEYKTATSLQNEIDARKKAKGIVYSWLEEVDGLKNQSAYNKPTKENNMDYILNDEV